MPPAEGAAPIASRLFLGPALRAQPDRRLVTLVREGYEAAFEEILRRYGRPLGRYAGSIVGGRSEDVVQEAFAKALPALQRDGAEIDLRPWLFRIVRNTALNDLRDSPPSPELLAEALVGGRDPAEELEQRERLTDLMRRLRELPEAQRAAIVMRELEGLGHDEIATALGLTDGGARQAIYRARQALRDGAGLLLPLPLLRLLIDHSGGAVGASAGGALAAAGASAGGAGAGGALKLGVVAAVVAGSVGAGVAVQSRDRGSSSEAQAAPAIRRAPATAARSTAARVDRGSVAAARVDRERGHSAASAAAPDQTTPPAAAQRVGRRLGGPAQVHDSPPPPRSHSGGHEGDRHGGSLDDEPSSSGGRSGPGSGRGDHSGPAGGEGEPEDGSQSGHDGGGGDAGSAGEGPGAPGDGGGGDGQADGGPPEAPDEGGSIGSDGSDESGASGESTTQGAGGETGREYESP